MPIARLSTKSWDVFRSLGSSQMDFVISLDVETASQHPAWPSQPETAVWGYPPLLLSSTHVPNREGLAEQALLSLQRRIELFVNLHAKSKHHSDLRNDLRDLARF
jgi:hypothetical protein